MSHPQTDYAQYAPLAVSILERALEINGNGKVGPQDMWTAIREALGRTTSPNAGK